MKLSQVLFIPASYFVRMLSDKPITKVAIAILLFPITLLVGIMSVLLVIVGLILSESDL